MFSMYIVLTEAATGCSPIAEVISVSYSVCAGNNMRQLSAKGTKQLKTDGEWM
jgi:hypothetical protein